MLCTCAALRSGCLVQKKCLHNSGASLSVVKFSCISFELDCKHVHQLLCDLLHLVVCCVHFSAEAVQETTEAVNSELHAEAV